MDSSAVRFTVMLTTEGAAISVAVTMAVRREAEGEDPASGATGCGTAADWAGAKKAIHPEVEAVFHASYQFGRSRIEDIVRLDAVPRGFSPELAREYLTRYIICELGAEEYKGLAAYLQFARASSPARVV